MDFFFTNVYKSKVALVMIIIPIYSKIGKDRKKFPFTEPGTREIVLPSLLRAPLFGRVSGSSER